MIQETPVLLACALLVWTAGWAWHLHSVWQARGLTDHDYGPMCVIALASVLLAATVWRTPSFVVVVLLPGGIAVAVVVARVRSRLMTKWRLMPGPPARPARRPDPLPAPGPVIVMVSEAEIRAQIERDEAAAHAELVKARGPGRMFY